MAALARTINSNDLTLVGTTAAIISFFVNAVEKRLSISTSDALIDPAVVNPEQAYLTDA